MMARMEAEDSVQNIVIEHIVEKIPLVAKLAGNIHVKNCVLLMELGLANIVEKFLEQDENCKNTSMKFM